MDKFLGMPIEMVPAPPDLDPGINSIIKTVPLHWRHEDGHCGDYWVLDLSPLSDAEREVFLDALEETRKVYGRIRDQESEKV